MSASLSRLDATITFGFDDGRSLIVSLRDGQFAVGDAVLGQVAPEGEFAKAFRALADRIADVEPSAALAAVRDWQPPTNEIRLAALRAALGGPPDDPGSRSGLAPQATPLDPAGIPVRAVRGPITVGRDEQILGGLHVADGDAEIAGRVAGDVVALRGNVRLRRDARVEGDVVAVRGRVSNEGASVGGRIVSGVAVEATRGPVARTWSALVSVAGVFVALTLIGVGILILAPHHLEVGAETVVGSLRRSFGAGLVGQALLLPTLVMIVAGLCVTIVGIIAVPFAVLGYVLLAGTAVLGGFLAVARVVGEAVTRRRLAAGVLVRSANSTTYLLTGLAVFAAIWLGAALFSAVPVAGWFFLALAVLLTWVAATVGLGAALLSRLGVREAFAQRVSRELTDEYLWPTPVGTPAERAARRRDPQE